MGVLSAPVIHVIRSFPLLQIYSGQLLSEHFKFLSDDDALTKMRLGVSPKLEGRVVEFVRNVSELRAATRGIWYLVNSQAERLSKRVGFSLRTIAPLVAHVGREIRVSEPSLRGFENLLAKITVYIFPFGSTTVKLSVKLDRDAEVGDVVRFLRSNSVKVRYKSAEIKTLQEFFAFLKLNVLMSLFKREALNQIQVGFGFQRFALFARAGSEGDTLKPEELASILFLDPSRRMLDGQWVEHATRKRAGMMTGDRILVSKQGMYVETPTLDQPGRESGRRLFRSIVSSSAIIAQAQEAALNAIPATISKLLSSPEKSLDSILVSLATCLNPEFTGHNVLSHTLLPLATWRRFYNLNSERLGLSELHLSVSRHAEAVISAVPLMFFGNFFKWLETVPTPHFELYIEKIRSKAPPTPIGIDHLNMPENAKKALRELITHYRYSVFRDYGKGSVPAGGFIRIRELARKAGLSIGDFYGDDGIVAKLRSLNLVEVAEEPSSGRGGTAIVIRVNPESPTIKDYLRLLGARQSRRKLSSP